MDLEKELTCSICTDILYQPLTLLDCLHTFCGSCLQEWFAWQAQSAASSRRAANTLPYTCPSCREAVRGTKGGWMLATMLEGYLRAHPDKEKSEGEKADIAKHYKPGDEVLVPVRVEAGEEDSEDERLMLEVREMSMAEVDPEVARRRRVEREARHRRRREGGEGTGEAGRAQRQQAPSRWASQHAQLTEARLRQHDPEASQIEHQPSLRSLLSASEADPQDVQAEILQSIYQEGMLDGIDLDNLTTAQEEELTERIADAYRRRQRERRRDRSRDRRRNERSPGRPATSGSTTTPAPNRSPPQVDAAAAPRDAHHGRSRPPIARPHLFEQTLDVGRGHARSQSSTSQRGNRSAGRQDGQAAGSPASRSATDLSLHPSSNDARRAERRRLSGSGRSVTDPHDGVSREHIQRIRARSNETRAPHSPSQAAAPLGQAGGRSASSSTPSLALPPQPARAAPQAPPDLVASPPSSPPATTATHTDHAVRPAVSRAAFAPEAVPDTTTTGAAPTPDISCARCNAPSIQHDLHYNCATCDSGTFNLCLRCYRAGAGCMHWFGFGFRNFERWQRRGADKEKPHVLLPRRYGREGQVEKGAFCDLCFAHADDGYWYCNICLEGAWGFCSGCVRRGRHCTHPLLPLTKTPHNPTTSSSVGLPHLPPNTYTPLPIPTDCDICTSPIPPRSPRFHCPDCSAGDYDLCTPCYETLISRGKISPADGPAGWRRCPLGHRMQLLHYRDGSGERVVLRERVGGVALREDAISLSGTAGLLPPDGGVGGRCRAVYSYWPEEGVGDELGFPRNAEVREVEDRNGDWFWGVYGGVGGLFPGNHVLWL